MGHEVAMVQSRPAVNNDQGFPLTHRLNKKPGAVQQLQSFTVLAKAELNGEEEYEAN